MSKSKRSDREIASILITLVSLFIIVFFVLRYIVQTVSLNP